MVMQRVIARSASLKREKDSFSTWHTASMIVLCLIGLLFSAWFICNRFKLSRGKAYTDRNT